METVEAVEARSTALGARDARDAEGTEPVTMGAASGRAVTLPTERAPRATFVSGCESPRWTGRTTLPVAVRSTPEPFALNGLPKGLSEKRATSELHAPSAPAIKAAAATRLKAEKRRTFDVRRISTHRRLRNRNY